ncbi:hypothetical protein [Kineococcus rhizosphaerae]|uniref:Fis family transcriptional regulator n=1 Tax=Kineococcus rhizosphaerae TaxID=559628 RepID=A0A2T0R007_9ACTN|nr:hypothetical protein [Kineococcus rhizosphaerae]PRY12445.1 hypothetical protein CLV37_1105 [Kineococcus rhizosphaerae]
MRWDDLFDDLEAQVDHDHRLDVAAEVADRVRREQATVPLADRVRAAQGAVSFALRDGSTAAGRVRSAGPGWFLLEEEGTRQVLVREDAVVSARGVPARSAAPLGVVGSRRTFLMAVRALTGERVRVRTSTGVVTGAITRVGADHFDVEVDQEVLVLPFGAVLTVRGPA